MTTQRIPLRMSNVSNQVLMIDIRDRKYEVKTTSMGTPPDSLPPLGKLITWLAEDETIVFKGSAITIVKETDDE